MSDSKHRISTSPDWGAMIFFAILVAGTLYFYHDGICHPDKYEDPMSLDYLIVSVLLGVYAIIICSVHYTFSEQYLIVKFLGIPFRFILWRSIHGAIYLHTWHESRQGQLRTWQTPSVVKGNAIFVSLGYCRQFNPEYDTRWRFQMANPMQTLFIRLPQKKAAAYIEAFQAFYPDLEIQPPVEKK